MTFQRRQPQPQPSRHEESRLFKNNPQPIENYRLGYPRLSAFLNSDKDFAVFRRFGRVHARLLLHKQDIIVDLEERLDALDRDEVDEFSLRSRRNDSNGPRQALLAKLEAKLLEYDTLLEAYLKQIERPPAQRRNARSVAAYLKAHKPLTLEESTFLCDWDDLVGPQVPGTSSLIETVVENSAATLHGWGISSIFSAARERQKTRDPYLLLLTTKRLAIGTRLLTGVLAVLSLTMPIVLLYYLRTMSSRIKAVALFTSCFTMFVSSVGQGRPIEIFSAAATYGAVLVVFLTYLPDS